MWCTTCQLKGDGVDGGGAGLILLQLQMNTLQIKTGSCAHKEKLHFMWEHLFCCFTTRIPLTGTVWMEHMTNKELEACWGTGPGAGGRSAWFDFSCKEAQGSEGIKDALGFSVGEKRSGWLILC